MNCGFTSNAFGAGSNFLEGIRRMYVHPIESFVQRLHFLNDDHKAQAKVPFHKSRPPSNKSTLSHAMTAYTRSTSRSKRWGSAWEVREGNRRPIDGHKHKKTRYETFYLPKKLNRHKTPRHAPKRLTFLFFPLPNIVDMVVNTNKSSPWRYGPGRFCL